MVDFLVDPEALAVRQCQWCTFMLGQERAAARLDGLERTLVQQAVLEVDACLLVEKNRIERGLCRPQGIEFGLDHRAVDIEVVALVDSCLAVITQYLALAVAGAHAVTLGVVSMQPFAHRAAVVRRHGLTQLPDGLLECTAVVFFLVGLAVALEAAPLVDVKQRTAEFAWLQWALQALGTQVIGIQLFPLLALQGVLGKEAVLNQQPHHPCLALEKPIASASHGARLAPADCQGAAVFRVTAVAEDAYSGLDDGTWIVFHIKPDHGPAYRCTAQVDCQSIAHAFNPHFSIRVSFDCGTV